MLSNYLPFWTKKTDDADSEDRKRKPTNLVELAFFVAMWYIAAVGAVTTSRKAMLICGFPYLLCTCQFATASIMTATLRFVERSSVLRSMLMFSPTNIASSSSSSNLSSLSSPCSANNNTIPPAAYQVIVYIALSYTFGFIFTNVAISVVNPSFVETIKAGEPLSSVFLGYFYFNEGTSLYTYLTLLPICSGVALSCVNNISFSFWGLLTAALSNLGFSSRSVLTKCLNKQFPSMIDEINLFAHISQLGLLLLVPLTIFMEHNELRLFLRNSSSERIHQLIQILLFNGCTYSIYNLVSFVVLSRTDLVTHAVLNVFRRVVIIAFTAFYFGVELKFINICGVLIAVFGVFAFGYAKNREGKELIYLSTLPMTINQAVTKPFSPLSRQE